MAFTNGPKLAGTRVTQRGRTVFTQPANTRTGWKIEVAPEFYTVAKRFQYSSVNLVASSMKAVILVLQRSAVKELQTQLMLSVYNNDLPDSVQSGKLTRAYYLNTMHRRQGQIYKAITTTPPIRLSTKMYEGTVKIDSSKILADKYARMSYYYARVLNYGHSTNPHYEPRPYWDISLKLMKARTRILAVKGIRSARDKLKGTLVVNVENL